MIKKIKNEIANNHHVSSSYFAKCNISKPVFISRRFPQKIATIFINSNNRIINCFRRFIVYDIFIQSL